MKSFKNHRARLHGGAYLSKVKDKPDSDDIYNNGEYQEASHKQDPATKSLPIEDSSVSSVKTASKKRRESDFERT